jgi:hypothetical protein
MKTVQEYIDWFKDARPKLESKEAERKIAEYNKKHHKYGRTCSGLPHHPLDDNQIILTDLYKDQLLEILENVGFKLTSNERKADRSYWNWQNKKAKGEDIDYVLRSRDPSATAMLCMDPEEIYFGTLPYETMTNPAGIESPSLEVELLGRRAFTKAPNKIITKLPMRTFATIHPNHTGCHITMEDMVIGILQQTIDAGANLFYGGIKTEKGVLHQAGK